MADKSTPPWTTEQVDALNAWQALGYVHEFTCPGGNGHPPAKPRKLVATGKGWFCPWCSYRQDWAHAFMADKSQHPPHPLESLREDKSTPRPWRIYEEAALDYRPCNIYDADLGAQIAVMMGGGRKRAISKVEERANAALIVSAVNQRAALLQCAEAFEEMRKILGYRYPRDAGPEAIKLLDAPWQRACSALSKLEQEPAS